MSDQSAKSKQENWSLGGFESVPTCPACGSASRAGAGMACNDPTIRLKDDVWQMQRCGRCCSLYLDPSPDAASLMLAYEEYETHGDCDPSSNYGQLNPLVWSMIDGYLNHRFGFKRVGASPSGAALFALAFPWRQKLDYYGRHLYSERFGNERRVLDVGCGNGAFLTIAREMGWDVLGIDPDPIGIALCAAKGVPAIQSTLDAIITDYEAQFDAITMSHSIEHLAEMPDELGRVFDLLRPGGMLWLATPNPKSLGARLFGRSWRGLRPPYHLCIPSQAALMQMAQSAGFEDIRFQRRGVHARRAFRESAGNVNKIPISMPRLRIALAPLAGLVSDALATVFVGLAEESVLIATKPTA